MPPGVLPIRQPVFGSRNSFASENAIEEERGAGDIGLSMEVRGLVGGCVGRGVGGDGGREGRGGEGKEGKGREGKGRVKGGKDAKLPLPPTPTPHTPPTTNTEHATTPTQIKHYQHQHHPPPPPHRACLFFFLLIGWSAGARHATNAEAA